MTQNQTDQLREATQALRDSEEQYRTLVANLPGVVYRCALDETWTMAFMSDAVESVLGYPASAFVGNAGLAFVDVIDANDRARVEESVHEALEAGLPWQIDYRVRHRDGRLLWLHERGRGVRDEHGNVMWLDGVLIDVTERRELETDLRRSRDEAERAARSRADFLARMSHELRTPMNAIIGLTELALADGVEPPTDGRLEDALMAARSMLRSIDDLLDLSRIDAGAITLARSPFRVSDAVTRVVAMMQPKALRRGLTLAADVDADVEIIGDRGRFEQIITNLLSNALKFTEQGRVDVHARAVHADADTVRVEIEVVDTGPGIGTDPTEIEALFSPFAQADISGTRTHGGVGLGLTLARRIARAMNGDVRAAPGPDGGTRASVRVTAPRASEQHRAHDALPEVSDLSGMRCLLVDDNDLNRRVARAFLGRAGVAVTEASEGREALAQALNETFDVVLMDLHMPGMDGFEAIRKLRMLPEHRTTPIVTLSALVSIEDRRRANAAGASAHIAKPIVAQDFYSTLSIIWHGAPLPDDLSPDAVERVGGDRVLLCSLWDELVQQARDCASELAACDEHDSELALSRLHRLRGAAGMVGCRSLYSACSDSEARLRAGEDVSTAIEPLDAATVAASEALEHLRAWSTMAPPT